eukprot:TRINITY_DN16808_c1_g1_i1.p2 TRINITY_DN16808_c1_g1~~TRINITY_DN16808_c1_g1_i1.p2  ORF type:complete len:327 (+),score=109.12 TRINITY_DN16808_c1_g1_i1:112-981(+)
MGSKRALLDPAARKRKRGAQPVAVPEPEEAPLDLWGADVPEAKRPSNKEHGGAKAARIERTDHLRKASIIPDGSQSYNPDKKQHELAMKKAAQHLLRKEAIQKAIEARTRVDINIRRGVVGDDLAGTEWDEEIEGAPRDDLGKSKDRKTRGQKNKLTRLMLEKTFANRKKQRKQVGLDADRIDDLMKELEQDKRDTVAKNKLRHDLNKNKESLRVGRKRFRAPALDLQTPDDIKPSVRSQGRVTASMRDPVKLRFESFQKRSILPAQTSTKRRRPKRPAKYYVVTKRDD